MDQYNNLVLDTSVTDGLYWKLGGNQGLVDGIHFLGTTDLIPVEFRTNNTPAIRLEPTVEQDHTYVNIVGIPVEDHIASGKYATIPGGVNNYASGMGSDAQADENGCFVWADTSGIG